METQTLRKSVIFILLNTTEITIFTPFFFLDATIGALKGSPTQFYMNHSLITLIQGIMIILHMQEI